MAGFVVTPRFDSIRALRVQNYLTQQELADAAGTTAYQIYRLEKGKQKASIGMLRNIAKALNVPVEDLIEQAATEQRAGTE